MTTTPVPPAPARAFELDAGRAIRITDPDGSRVGDLELVPPAPTLERSSSEPPTRAA